MKDVTTASPKNEAADRLRVKKRVKSAVRTMSIAALTWLVEREHGRIGLLVKVKAIGEPFL